MAIDDAHAGCERRLGDAARLGVGRVELVEVARRRAVDGASVRSTVSAISRKPMRPSRNAATATSLAALNAQG